MIKFFRKIRQQLMNEGNTLRYLKYALGEIFLVVIGILIALSINDWSEQQKADKLRINLLESLKSDLEQDLRRLEVLDRFLEGRENYSKMILDYFNDIPDQVDSIPTFLALERSGYVHTFNPPMPTYNEMMGSGNLTLIKSEELKKALATYKTVVETSSEIERRYAFAMTDFANRALAYMDEGFGFIDISNNNPEGYQGLKFDLKAMSKDRELVVLLKNVRNKSIIERRYKNDLITPRVEKLIDLINNELN